MAPSEPPLINIEPENDPDAVIQWYRLTSESSYKRQCTLSRDLSLQAKKHLCYLGWTFFHVHKLGRWELRYRSPISGKNYISLRRACQGCIEEGGCNNFNVGLVQQDNIDQQHSSSSSTLKKPRNCKKKKRQRDYGSSSSSHDSGRGKVLSTIRMLHEGTSESSQQLHRGTIISRLIDKNIVDLDSLVFCRGANNVVKKGKIIRGGIVCDCCGVIFSPTRFEAHAGCSKHRPASTIFLEDGRSLMDCQREALCLQKNVKEEESDQRECQNDNICSVCRYGGDLVLCDRCPSSFHLSCLGLDSVPDGDWFCPACCCKTCKRLRYSEDCADDVVVNRLLVCHQCKRSCHIGCIAEIGKENYLDHHENWFCSGACEKIFFSLQKLVGKPIHVGGGMTWTLLKSVKSDSWGGQDLTGDEVEGSSQIESKLSVALGILHECFDPVIEAFSGTDMIAGIVFSRSSEISCLNFSGFYTVVLEKDEEVVSVATIRIFGKRVAEIPFVATGIRFRRLGMCKILMNEIEKQLSFLGVEEIVLPSSDTVIDTWTNSFGFTRMSLSDKYQFLGYNFLEFERTTMCLKPLVKQIVT